MKNVKISVLLLVLLTLLAATVASAARADGDSLKQRMGAIEAVLAAKDAEDCKMQSYFARKFTNACSKTLDALVEPVAAAKEALGEEEARLNKLACPSLIDYGCTPSQIRHRETARFVTDAIRELGLIESQTLEDRRREKLYQRVLGENHLSVLWAEDFFADAKEAFDAYLEAVAALSE